MFYTLGFFQIPYNICLVDNTFVTKSPL